MISLFKEPVEMMSDIQFILLLSVIFAPQYLIYARLGDILERLKKRLAKHG